MLFRCQNPSCNGICESDDFFDEKNILEDGDIFWGTCRSCGLQTGVSCIVTTYETADGEIVSR